MEPNQELCSTVYKLVTTINTTEFNKFSIVRNVRMLPNDGFLTPMYLSKGTPPV